MSSLVKDQAGAADTIWNIVADRNIYIYDYSFFSKLIHISFVHMLRTCLRT